MFHSHYQLRAMARCLSDCATSPRFPSPPLCHTTFSLLMPDESADAYMMRRRDATAPVIIAIKIRLRQAADGVCRCQLMLMKAGERHAQMMPLICPRTPHSSLPTAPSSAPITVPYPPHQHAARSRATSIEATPRHDDHRQRKSPTFHWEGMQRQIAVSWRGGWEEEKERRPPAFTQRELLRRTAPAVISW